MRHLIARERAPTPAPIGVEHDISPAPNPKPQIPISPIICEFVAPGWRACAIFRRMG